MPMGTLGQPGAGFLPFWVAVALGLMSFGLIAHSLRGRPESPGAAPEQLDRRRTVGLLCGLALYSLLLEWVGFLPTTFLLLAGLTRMLDASGWRAPVVFGALATGGAWALFGLWLGVPLPKGSLLP
jgi:putative tricarboxylic transport membrane protein